ncbi:MAG: GIY-YIG nuclease family protein [Sphaerochaetaceae bacterium]|nr:GIY-YIG nuclease family protein [Sphaerochaetaceae bacterium]
MNKTKLYLIYTVAIILLLQSCDSLQLSNQNQVDTLSFENDQLETIENNVSMDFDSSKIEEKTNEITTNNNKPIPESTVLDDDFVDNPIESTEIRLDSQSGKIVSNVNQVKNTEDINVEKTVSYEEKIELIKNKIISTSSNQKDNILDNSDKSNLTNYKNKELPEVVINENFTSPEKDSSKEDDMDVGETSEILINENNESDSNIEKEEIPMWQKNLMLLFIILTIIFIYTTMKNSKKYNKEKLRNEKFNIKTIEDSDKLIKKQKELQYNLKENIRNYESQLQNLKLKKTNLTEETNQLSTKVENSKKTLRRLKEIYNSINYSIKEYRNNYLLDASIIDRLKVIDIAEAKEYAPTVLLDLKYMGYKDLRKEYNYYFKLVKDLLEKYKKFYTTKTNITIYNLMVMALQAELQNILYKLKYEKLSEGIKQVKDITSKYLTLCISGNKTIKPTLARFIGELEYLYIAMVKVEYEYYIKREQAKQEQMAIRQQMKEEAQERKRLKEEEKRIKEEESKYLSEIDNLKSALQNEDDENKIKELNIKINELSDLVENVEEQKDEILRLQNGKAGNVYIISNLGSFGDNVFKIGMTRRLDPQERINELGSASVPFKFDVHSFIFSEDAVTLEKELHNRLNNQRVNKINLRKEFFNISIDELESLVLEINPTAEFNKTMIAEEYHQSESQNVS